VRRLAVPALVANIPVALRLGGRLLRALLRCLSACWVHWRRHLKVELAVVADELLLGTLAFSSAPPVTPPTSEARDGIPDVSSEASGVVAVNAAVGAATGGAGGGVRVSPAASSAVLACLAKWFELPELPEVFVNFDLGGSAGALDAGADVRLVERFVTVVCGVAETLAAAPYLAATANTGGRKDTAADKGAAAGGGGHEGVALAALAVMERLAAALLTLSHECHAQPADTAKGAASDPSSDSLVAGLSGRRFEVDALAPRGHSPTAPLQY